MSTIAQPIKTGVKPWVWIALLVGTVVLFAEVRTPNMPRERVASTMQSPDVPLPATSEPYSSMSQGFAFAGPTAARAMVDARASAGNIPDRKIVRMSSLDLIVGSPAQSAEKIRLVAEGLGGYLESAQIGGNESGQSTSITIRVPAARLEDAKTEIRKLAERVESEKTDAKDVTKEYVDMEAGLRNLRAQEAQYLQIMKSATKVQDMLDVSEHVSEVRGQIEQQQAEYETLGKQVETAAITVSLRAQVQTKAEVSWSSWQPLYRLKLATRDGLDAVADYGAAMLSVILYLPVILLWVGTIVLGVAAGWRVVRWVGRVLFPLPKVSVPTTPVG